MYWFGKQMSKFEEWNVVHLRFFAIQWESRDIRFLGNSERFKGTNYGFEKSELNDGNWYESNALTKKYGNWRFNYEKPIKVG